MITRLFKDSTLKEVLVQGEKLAIAAMNSVEVESDDDLIIKDETEEYVTEENEDHLWENITQIIL